MKTLLALFLICITVTLTAQMPADSLKCLTNSSPQIKLCSKPYKESTERENERIVGIVRQKLKEINVEAKGCWLVMELRFQTNCNGEVGNWHFTDKGAVQMKFKDSYSDKTIELARTIFDMLYRLNYQFPKLAQPGDLPSGHMHFEVRNGELSVF